MGAYFSYIVLGSWCTVGLVWIAKVVWWEHRMRQHVDMLLWADIPTQMNPYDEAQWAQKFNQHDAEEKNQWLWFWRHVKSFVTRAPLKMVDNFDPTLLWEQAWYQPLDREGREVVVK